MKLILTTLLGLMSCYMLNSQVGIGNTNPKATLDISASNTTTPTNADGILIPRIDNFPTTNPGADQDGMMVFATGNGTPAKGFYYWDNGSTSWTSVSGVNTQNTLDQAYDQGGAGYGRTINADNGAVRIIGEDGLLVSGTYGSGDAISVIGFGAMMYFNPRKAAFRAGQNSGSNWNDANVGEYSFAAGRQTLASGDYSSAFGNNTDATGTYATAFGNATEASGSGSVAFGVNTEASGYASSSFGIGTTASQQQSVAFGNGTTASGFRAFASGIGTTASGANSSVFGRDNTASGTNSSVFGSDNTAPSFGETALGIYATNYTPNSAVSYNVNDRLFVIGNGTFDASRSNALTIYKSGLMNINDAYNMPLTDGANGQVMTTDGSGAVTFQDLPTYTDTDEQDLSSSVVTANEEVEIAITNGTNTTINIQDADANASNELITSASLNGTDLEIIEAGSTTTVDLSALQNTNTQNTLDQAYDQGGAGSGATINATDGAVRINGDDGLLITGTLNTGNTIDTEITGAGTRMFFNPRTASFRAGQVDGTQWNHANLGLRSAAFGNNNTASGNASTAFGANNTSSGNRSLTIGDDGVASGQNSVAMGEENDALNSNTFAQGYRSTASGNVSVAMGLENNAPSWGEMTVGAFATSYTANSTTSWNTDDRIFTVGNGSGTSLRSNALTIYKNGIININDAYNMPTADGTNGQVMTTDGAGNVTFQDAAGVTDTDDQTIDVLNLNGTNLEISLEDDGVATQTLDLSSLQDGTGNDWSLTGNVGTTSSNFIGTTDNQSLRFRTNNSTKMTLTTKGQLEFFNTGRSVFIGDGAGENDDLSNNNNTFIGYRSGFNNTSGFSNVALGYIALTDNTSGRRNVALGPGALQNNTTGFDNIAIGSSTLVSTTASQSNIAIGYVALFNKLTGNRNIAIGEGSGSLDENSERNIYIGYRSGGGVGGDPAENKTDNVFIGYESGFNESGSNKLYIENTNSTTPLIYGTFDTDEVGINWNAATALPNTLSVNGNASKTTAGSWLANSDARLKKNIKNMNSQTMLEKVLAMQGVTYNWNDDKTGIERPETIQYGFIAQDLQKIWPTKVTEDGQGYLQTAYGDYDAMFVEAFKAQQHQIDLLQQENKILKEKLNKLQQLEARLSALEAHNSKSN